MLKTRTQKAALNTATAALSELVHLGCGLILPRMILSYYGSSYNGITSSAKQFLSAVSILTVGVSGTTRFALYRSLLNHDIKKTSGVIRATEKYMRKVGIVLLIYVAILTVVYPLLKDTGYGWTEVAPLIIAAGISASGRYFFGTTYMALLSADQSIYISNIFLIAANITNLLISTVLIRKNCSIQVVKLCSSFALLLSPFLRAVYVRKKYKLDRACEPDYSALSLRRDVMAHSIANIVHDHTDIIVLTIFCNVKIVSVYTIYNLVMNALKKTQQIFTSGTEAVFGNMWAKEEVEKIKQSLGCYEYIISAFVSIVFSATVVLLLPFISLYTKGVHDVEYILPIYAIVITGAQMFYSFRTPYLTIVQGVGHYKQTKNGAYAEAIINIVTSVILVKYIGIVGVAVGTLIANVFRTVQYALYIDKHIVPRGKTVFARRILWTVSNILIIYFIVSSKASQFAYLDWKAWIVTALIISILSILLTALSSLIFYRKDFFSTILLVYRVIGKKRKNT